ncbi:hypothetical protein G6F27_013084 [Rhizopus arrhizus]|nr:hypothetical protein G6F27_013084 [Rhizopus arrhizus]
MDYCQAFVFKQLRPKKLIQSLDGVFSLFFTAVDQLPHTFDRVVINPQTALCLTLGDVSISSSSCPLPKSMACLPSSHAYQVDPTSGRLQPKCSTDIRSRPYLTKRFLKWPNCLLVISLPISSFYQMDGIVAFSSSPSESEYLVSYTPQQIALSIQLVYAFQNLSHLLWT